MISGTARITAVDQHGRAFVEDVNAGDLWLFPGGIPHSIQGVGADGATFLLVFNDGNFNEFQTFLLTDWMHHTPRRCWRRTSTCRSRPSRRCPRGSCSSSAAPCRGRLRRKNVRSPRRTEMVSNSFAFFTGQMQPTKVSKGGEVRIVDRKNFPATNIAAAIVTLKPGGLRELHWHPNEDEWQYFVKGKGRMTVFSAGGHARTMDFQEGDVGTSSIRCHITLRTPGTRTSCFWRCFRHRSTRYFACGVAGAYAVAAGGSAHCYRRGFPAEDPKESDGSDAGVRSGGRPDGVKRRWLRSRLFLLRSDRGAEETF